MRNVNFRLLKIVGLFLVLSVNQSYAQLSVKGIPESFNLPLKNATIIPSLELDSIDANKLRKEDSDFRIDNRYGVVQPYTIDLKEAGVKTDIPGKGTIWQYKIDSKDALSIGVFFKQFRLPKGARLFFYDPSKSYLQGAFSALNNNPENQLPVAEFPRKDLIIEYFEPFSSEFSGELVIGSVSQAYVDLEALATTRIGINCPQGANWADAKNSVCLMTFSDTKYSYFCTGALVNNVREDGTPYFLTANHCISTDTEAGTLVTYFGYENSICSSNDASKRKTLAGATLKSTNSYSDFSLLLLKEYPSTDYNPFYAGWNAAGDLPASGVGIHHPQGTPKCIAVDNSQVKSYPYLTSWTDDSGKVTSTTVANSHWWVVFSEGDTEAGSSGSPFFDQNKRIVGQLHGGGTGESLYGKLSLSWNYSSTNSKQLAHWLDPDNTGKKVMDGLGKVAPKAAFYAEVQDVCANTPVLFTDKSSNKPTQWLWRVSPASFQFAAGTDSISQNPKISFLKDGIYSVTLKASNQYGSDLLVQNNYISAKSKLDVSFYKAVQKDSTVCGCDLNAFPLIAKGAFSYNFQVSEKAKISTAVKSDTLLLTLNSSAIGGNSFDTWVKVTGTHGACSASDSILLHVTVQPNDNIKNAAALLLGSNSGYSNRCATAETNEPAPTVLGCLVVDSWCPKLAGKSSVLDNSLWFSFIAPSNGRLTIDTKGFDDQIAVYDADSEADLLTTGSYKLVAANDDRSASDNTSELENLQLTPGKKYWLQVDGKNAAYGNIAIDLISNSLEIYPNPSSGNFNMVIANPVDGLAKVFVYSIQGQKIYEEQLPVSMTSNKFTLDLSNLASGMYMLNVQMNGYNHSKKLILKK